MNSAWPNDTARVDVASLLESRLLVQANSGGGKSWALRRLLEQTAPDVQQLVIDPEGEFATLRQSFDYIIAAPHDADAVATPKTAALLARRLLEAGVSAILDIYDLKAHERQQFVRRFLDALINAPRTLWKPVMVVLDEAHTFCPQSGSAEASSAVIDLATRGRKRGQCLVLATQRLSKLHKDAAAEMLNKLVGRTGLDVDVRRAADELGMTPREAVEQLRNLKPGEFYAYGPALSTAVQKVTIGPVLTSHPKSGHRLRQAPPAASKRVLASLAKLADLQHEADEEAKTLESLSANVTDLRRKLTIAERRAEQAGVPETEVQKRILKAVAEAKSAAVPAPAPAGDARVLGRIAALSYEIIKLTNSNPDATLHSLPEARAPRQREASPPRSPAPAPGPIAEGVNAAQQKILDVLAQMESLGVTAADKSMVAAHAGVSPTSGGYFNNLGRLRSMGLIEYPAGGTAALTDEGRAKANFPEKALTLQDLHESWLRILPAPQAAILSVLLRAHPEAMTKDELADAVGVSRTSGGYFNNLGRLRTLGAIDYPQKGTARAAPLLYPEIGRR